MKTNRESAPTAVAFNVDIHPELRKDLRRKALDENLSAKVKLHRLLCDELGRPDLMDQVPVRPVRSPAP